MAVGHRQHGIAQHAGAFVAAAAIVAAGAVDGAVVERRHRAAGAELQAAQRIGGQRGTGAAGAAGIDQSALGDLDVADMILVHEQGLGAAGAIGGILHQAGAAPPFGLADEHRVRAGGVVCAQQQMAAAAAEAGAPGPFQGELSVADLGAVAHLQIGLEAFELLVEHQVDHAGHRVGALGGRGAAGHHLDAPHQGGGQGGEIDAAAQQVGRHHALAVEQHQGA